MSKKTFIILGIVLAVILLALAGYYFLVRTTVDPVTGQATSGFKNFFPFGKSDTGSVSTTTTSTTNNEQNLPPLVQNYASKLREISREPVAGADMYDGKGGVLVRHIEKATGHIYETELFSASQTRISNTTLPFVYDAGWASTPNTLMSRYLKDDNQTVVTYSFTFTPVATSTNQKVTAVLFPNGINDYSVFGTNVFFIQQGGNGSIGTISTIAGANKKQVWNSPIREVLSQYVNANTVLVTTKPYQNLGGYAYLINTNNGSSKKILGNVAGLSTLMNPDATKVLGISQAGDINMFTYTLSDNSYTTITPVTFPEKCVWSKKDKNTLYCAVPEEILFGSSLTDWYTGLSSYTDDIWKYDIKNNTSSMVENLLTDSKQAIDATKLQLSTNEQYLVFINKRDGSLWSLDLSK